MFLGHGLGVRHIQACWLFAAMVFGYFLRVNMSIAVVAMTKSSENPNIEKYDWDSSTRSTILSSFFWGYVLAQFPAAMGAQRFGAKNVLTLSTIVCSILTAAIPWAASVGDWTATCIIRVLVGFFQGSVYPCVHNLLAKWVPRTERGFLSSVTYSGAQLGTVIMLAVSGPIVTSYIGWPSLFYISGGVAFIWAIAYLIFGAETPDHSNIISTSERDYVKKLTGNSMITTLKTPWKDMFTSRPFIALIFAHSGFTWGFYTLLTEMPTYMDGVLDMHMGSNGLLSALPYFVMWILCLIVSPVADFLINRGYMTATTSRKLFNTIGQWVPMLCLIGLGYMDKNNVEFAIALLTLAVGVNSASYVGYLVNHMDLSPNFAGTMMGITNGISNLLSIFAPLVVGGIVENEADSSEWRTVFFITAGFYFVCNLMFIILGSAEVQPWNHAQINDSALKINSNQNKQNDP